MTYRDFWEGDVFMTEAYRKAYDLKRKNENYMAWLQGRYIYDALCEASPLFRMSFSRGRISPAEYTKEPYPITEAEAEERRIRKQKEDMERLKNAFMEFASNIKIKRTQSADERRSVDSTEDTENVRDTDRQPTDTNRIVGERSGSFDRQPDGSGQQADEQESGQDYQLSLESIGSDGEA